MLCSSLRQALISCQDYRMLLLTLSQPHPGEPRKDAPRPISLVLTSEPVDHLVLAVADAAPEPAAASVQPITYAREGEVFGPSPPSPWSSDIPPTASFGCFARAYLRRYLAHVLTRVETLALRVRSAHGAPLTLCTDFQTPTCGTRKPTRMATGGWSMWTRISARCCARPRRRSRQRKRRLRPRRRVGPGPPAAAFTRRSLATARDHACCRRDSTAQDTRAADRPRQDCADDQTPRATGVGNKDEASHH